MSIQTAYKGDSSILQGCKRKVPSKCLPGRAGPSSLQLLPKMDSLAMTVVCSSRQGPARPGVAPVGSHQACYVPSYRENPTKSSVLVECQCLGPDSTCNTYMDYRLSQHLPATHKRDTLERAWA